MNVNDFLVPPNNKAKSVKLNARNLQDLQKVTATLSDRRREMEEKLQQLKENMSKEKEERGFYERLKWTSGQCGSLTSNFQIYNSKKNKESTLQRLSAGKVKIRVLKEELLPIAPPQPPPPGLAFGHQATRKSTLKRTACGQCDIRTAGVKCPECTENYCIGCFNKFHQKGALKLHRMVPIQRDLQTHVNSQDIAICIQKAMNPSFYPSVTEVPNPSTGASSITPKTITRQGDKSPEKGRKDEDNYTKLAPDGSQVLIVDHGEKRQEEVIGIDKQKSPSTLLRGEYNEEESARAFQEVVRQWRVGRRDGGAELVTDANAGWIPARPASVSAMATQADPHTDKGAQGQRRGVGEGRVTVKVEFTQNSLTYADRLLLKKHRRTPINVFDSPVPLSAHLEPSPTIKAENNSAGSLTAEEEDFRHYWTSLFDAPVSRDRTDPQITPPESCRAIEVLNETYTDAKHGCDTKQRTEFNPEVIFVQRITRKERPQLLETSLSSGAFTDISQSSGPSQTSRALKPETAPKPLSSKLDGPQTLRSSKTLRSKSKPSAFSTAEASGTSKASIRTLTSKSLRSICSPTVNKSKANHGSPQFLSSLSQSQPDISKSSHSPLLFSADVLASANNKSAVPEEHLSHSPSISFSLRSSFTVSPLGSTESTLLPNVYHPTLLQEGSDASVLPDIKQTFPQFAKPISCPELCDSPRGSRMSQQQSQPFLCDQQPLLPDEPVQLLLSHVSTSKHAPPKSLEPSQSELGPETPATSLSRTSLISEFSPEECCAHISTLTYQEVPLFMSPAQKCGGHLSTPHRDAHDTLISSCQRLNDGHMAALTVNMEKKQKESRERGNEMSSRLALNEEDSAEEEALMRGFSVRARTKEEQEHPAISQHEESFVPSKSVSEAEAGTDYQTDKPVQLQEPSVVMHERGAGPGSQQFCDLNGLSPLGLDLNAGDFDTPEHAHCDPLHTCQSAPHDTDPTGSESRGSHNSLRASPDQHLVFRLMKDNNTEPTGVKIHSTGGSKMSQREPGTSEFDPAPRMLSEAAQEIKEVSSVDQADCEDPDLDTDITAHILYGREQSITKETSLGCLMGISGNCGQPGNCHFIRNKVSDEEDEEAVESDRHAVLLLP